MSSAHAKAARGSDEQCTCRGRHILIQGKHLAVPSCRFFCCLFEHRMHISQAAHMQRETGAISEPWFVAAIEFRSVQRCAQGAGRSNTKQETR